MDSYRSTRPYISNFVWRRASTSSRLVHALCSEDNWNLSNRNASLRLKFLWVYCPTFSWLMVVQDFNHPKICQMCKKGEETSHSAIGYLIVCGRVEGSMNTTAYRNLATVLLSKPKRHMFHLSSFSNRICLCQAARQCFPWEIIHALHLLDDILLMATWLISCEHWFHSRTYAHTRVMSNVYVFASFEYWYIEILYIQLVSLYIEV